MSASGERGMLYLGNTYDLKKDKVTFYQAIRDGKELNVVSAIGHLYTVVKKNKTKTWEYPFWDTKWVPSHEINKKADKGKADFIDFITVEF